MAAPRNRNSIFKKFILDAVFADSQRDVMSTVHACHFISLRVWDCILIDKSENKDVFVNGVVCLPGSVQKINRFHRWYQYWGIICLLYARFLALLSLRRLFFSKELLLGDFLSIFRFSFLGKYRKSI